MVLLPCILQFSTFYSSVSLMKASILFPFETLRSESRTVLACTLWGRWLPFTALAQAVECHRGLVSPSGPAQTHFFCMGEGTRHRRSPRADRGASLLA